MAIKVTTRDVKPLGDEVAEVVIHVDHSGATHDGAATLRLDKIRHRMVRHAEHWLDWDTEVWLLGHGVTEQELAEIESACADAIKNLKL